MVVSTIIFVTSYCQNYITLVMYYSNMCNFKMCMLTIGIVYIVYFLISSSFLLSENSSVLFIDEKSMYNINYTGIYSDIKFLTKSKVYWKGTRGYNKRRILENGLCNHIFPNLIVIPKSTNDVANIVKISRKYKGSKNNFFISK